MTDLEPPQNRESRIQDEDAFSSMDRMYRYQRYFYNVTRKYYLLGRDKLLSEMDVQSGENVLEIGCGTGRNLAILAKRLPNAHFFGLDASAAMLETAAETVARSNLTNITLKTALADSFSCDKTFELDQPFDAVFFSYSISMMHLRTSLSQLLIKISGSKTKTPFPPSPALITLRTYGLRPLLWPGWA